MRATEARPAATEDIPRMAVTLARAFHDDPVLSWMVPRARRSRRMARMFELLLTAQVELGGTWTTPDGIAAAVWAPPDRWKLDFDALAGFTEELVAALGSNIGRALEVIELMEGHHPVDTPHWYLASLGTHPDWQRRGVGAVLMEPVLTRADEEGIPAYLESSKAENVPYYRRFGFEVTGEVTVPDGPTLWPMWRDPRPAS